MRVIIRYILAFVKELAFLAGVWSPKVPVDIDESISEFVTANKPYWPELNCRDRGILIEGHLSQYGPNYLLRTAVAARAIQEKTNLDIEVIFNGFSHQWVSSKKAYRSFGIDKWVHMGNYFFVSNFAYYFLSRVFAVWHVSRLNSPEDILKITFNSIKVGDLIYDDVLRNAKQKTIETINGHVRKAIANSFYYYLQYRQLFKRRSYTYYVATHTAYSEYGLLCRVALMNGVKLIETTDIQMAFYEQISNERLPTYHDGIKNSILSGLKGFHLELEKLRVDAKQSLHLRLDSKIMQIDAQKAYVGKIYNKSELEQKLGIEHGRKIVFVLAHVFSDAPHLSSAMLHADYYQWLSTTLDICAKSTGVSWIIKPHPSSAIYGESGLVERMVQDVKSSNVLICPADLNTKSLSTCSDALITVHGTAGLEFSCLGMPVVLAGKPFYSGFGFTNEPHNKADYEKTLIGLSDIVPLTSDQINKALEVYAIWNQQFDWHNPIITSKVLANVWGSEVPRNLLEAYRLITENLRVTDPRKLKLWEFVQGVVG